MGPRGTCHRNRCYDRTGRMPGRNPWLGNGRNRYSPRLKRRRFRRHGAGPRGRAAATPGRPRCDYCRNVGMPGKGIVNTKDSNRAAPRRFICQYSYSGFAKSGPDCVGGCPMVVITKHGNDSEPRPQLREWSFKGSSSLCCASCVGADREVSRNQDQIGTCCVYLINDCAQPHRVHRAVAQMNIRQQSDTDGRRAGRPSRQCQARPTLDWRCFRFAQAKNDAERGQHCRHYPGTDQLSPYPPHPPAPLYTRASIVVFDSGCTVNRAGSSMSDLGSLAEWQEFSRNEAKPPAGPRQLATSSVIEGRGMDRLVPPIAVVLRLGSIMPNAWDN